MTNCTECGSDNIEKINEERFKCLDCGHSFTQKEIDETQEFRKRVTQEKLKKNVNGTKKKTRIGTKTKTRRETAWATLMTLTSCLCSIVYNAWYFYRDLITFVATFGRKNYAGQNIRILGKRAVKYFYGGDTACGGCTHGFPCIYIFMHDSRLSNPEDAIADIITHETLHQVIFLIGERRSRWDGWDGLDNIHFLRWKSFGGNKLPEIYADFVGEGKWDKYKIHGGLLKQPSI